MFTEILQLALKNGLWAVLFLVLLFYVLKDSRKRETKYQNTIEKLNEHLNAVNDIKKEVGEIIEIITTPKKSKKLEAKNENEQ